MDAYESQAARDAQSSGYGGKDYWDYLDNEARELRDKFLRDGDTYNAAEMMERSLSRALHGNDGI